MAKSPKKVSTKKSATKKSSTKKSTGKRTEIAPKGDKRYVRRNEEGRFTESDDESKSLSKDVKQHAKNKVKPGYGDKGDQAKKDGGDLGPKESAKK